MPLVGKSLQKIEYPLKAILFYCFQPGMRRHWKMRIDDVMNCPDNSLIPRVHNAGSTNYGFLIMHNGIKIIKGSYYGVGMRLLLKCNQGVHEPQEERLFMEVLKYMPEEAVMIELGSYWGFYSMWFQKEVKRASCFLVEPELRNLEFGRENFSFSGMKGCFRQGFVGAASGRNENEIPIVCVDDFVIENKIGHINILHADIQSAEHDMLLGTRKTFESKKVDYVFISTHTNELHDKCLSFLKDHGFEILADADLNESYSIDGIIAARRSDLEGLKPLNISKK